MKSLRLNKEIRADILTNINTAYTNENVAPKVVDDRKSHLRAVILKWYLEENKTIIDLYTKSTDVVKEFIRTNTYFCINDTHADVLSIYFNGIGTSEDDVRLPTTGNYFKCLDDASTVIPAYVQKVINDNKASAKRIRLEKVDLSAYNKELVRYMQDVKQVIDGCNTTGQLLTVWPEIEKFLPKGMFDPVLINLPSVNVNALNRKLSKK